MIQYNIRGLLKMINFGNFTGKNRKEHNAKWY